MSKAHCCMNFMMLFCSLLAFIMNANSIYGQDQLLPLKELYNLDNHSVIYGANGEILEVRNDRTQQQVKDYSLVEKITLSTNIDDIDTLWVSNESFPNLKSLVLKGLFFNELTQVSKIKTLQHLDITGMSLGDFNTSSYALFFPEEFWKLKSLQSLQLSAGHISDISEKVVYFNQLKHLELCSHGAQDKIAIPWNLLFMKNFEVLSFVNMDNYDQEDITLFRECAHFFVLNDGIDFFLRNPASYALKKSRRTAAYTFQNQTLKLTKDHLSLLVPLDEDGLPNGVATLRKRGEIIQNRTYENGMANGRWDLRFGAMIQKRNYTDGNYSGKWVFMKKAPYLGYRKTRIKIKRGGEKVIIRYRPVFNAFRVKYIDYNDMGHFENSFG